MEFDIKVREVAKSTSLTQMPKPPAELGVDVSNVETPALIVDLDAFEHNCRTLRSMVKSELKGVTCRPHAKMHKSAEVAALQLELLGSDVATGVCAQTVTEAEAMVAGGIEDVMVTNQVVTPGKMKRLAAIARRAKVSVVVDSVENVFALSDAMTAAEASVTVLVEVNVGQDRCGVDTAEEALALALAVKAYNGLEWGGIQAYHGGIQHVRTYEDRKAAADAAIARARVIVDALEAEGHGCPTVTGAGTGTFYFEGASGLYTEIQPGSWFFGDGDYGRNEGGQPGAPPEWEQALYVATTVISASKERNQVVVDVGSKAVSLDAAGPPSVRGADWLKYTCGGDEHGIVTYREGACSDLSTPEGTVLPQIGQMMRLIPGHIDPTVNMHDWLCFCRGDRVAEIFRISGRGPGC